MKLLENKKAVIFDLDGTLVDSMWMWESIDIAYLARFGLEYPEDLNSCVEGMSFTETAEYFKKRFELPSPLEQIKEDWNRMAWDIYAGQVPLKTGAGEFLAHLKEQGIAVGIATSNSRELAELALRQLAVGDYIDVLKTSCEVERGKPYPDIYLSVADALRAEPASCLVFEDVVQGILSGKRAGMEVCAVEDALSNKDILQKREYADYYMEDFLKLLQGEYEELNSGRDAMERRGKSFE